LDAYKKVAVCATPKAPHKIVTTSWFKKGITLGLVGTAWCATELAEGCYWQTATCQLYSKWCPGCPAWHSTAPCSTTAFLGSRLRRTYPIKGMGILCWLHVHLQVKALVLTSSSKQAGPGGTGPREASTDDVMRAADALVKSKELLGALKKKLANAAVPVRSRTGKHTMPRPACWHRTPVLCQGSRLQTTPPAADRHMTRLLHVSWVSTGFCVCQLPMFAVTA